MRPKNPKQPTRTIKPTKRCIIKLPFELHDYSETLTFDQVMDTLFIVGQYLNNEDHSMFLSKDIPAVQEWLRRNDINKFFTAKHAALQAQAKIDESKEFAREIMNLPVEKRESWH